MSVRMVVMAVAAAALGAATAMAEPVKTAEPVKLTDRDLDKVTAGIGANNVAVAPWDALLEAGFSLNHLLPSDAGAAKSDQLGGVAVPSAVPQSFCISFCDN